MQTASPSSVRPVGNVIEHRAALVQLAQGCEQLSRARYRAVLDIARDKFRYIGTRFTAPTITDQPTVRLSWVPMELRPNTPKKIDIPQRKIWEEVFDRQGLASDPLGTIPALAHFHYENIGEPELFGLTSWFRPDDEPAERR